MNAEEARELVDRYQSYIEVSRCEINRHIEIAAKQGLNNITLHNAITHETKIGLVEDGYFLMNYPRYWFISW